MTYKKPPLTYADQVKLLQKRKLSVPNTTKAENYLAQISYYRFSAYFLPFQKVKDVFNAGSNFDEILDLYTFDREFRLLVFDAIERIEIAFRTQMIYHLSHKYGSHWQDNPAIFKPPYINPYTGKTVDIFADTQQIICNHCSSKHPEVFIKHYKSHYTKPANPPGWMSIELLTIGELSRLYTVLKDNSDKKAIADFFGLHHTTFTSWIHTLVYTRNLCAHHARLWNREYAIKPDILLKPQHPWLDAAFNTNSHRSFYILSLMKYMLLAANPRGHFKQKWESLLTKYPNLPIQYMGIPTDASGNLIDWKTQPLWK
ncbi:MAG TPA: CAAX protease [Chryseobacterium sp.]|nr:CAAX protease [Chryseobacterium sp.]